jgi:two-component system, LuxR family, response regulator FixJ
MMAVEQPVLFVIAGDPTARRKLFQRLKQFAGEVRACHAPEEFQRISSPHDAGCVLLHVAQAEFDLDWLTSLGQHEHHWPVIAIAAEATLETAVLAMKRGAFDFLLESLSDQQLQAALDEALRWDDVQRRHIAHVQTLRRRLKQLSEPLRDVLELLLKGKSNREIALELGMSVRSIEVRRAKVMQIMKARSLAALVRQALLAHGLGPSRSSLGAATPEPASPGPAAEPAGEVRPTSRPSLGPRPK